MSALLFYGSSAKENALKEARRVGRILLRLDKDDLKAQRAREAVAAINTVPVGDSVGVVVVGPVDRASRKVSDVLLKAVEEHDEEVVRPILWAEDLGGVSATLRSRCVAVWCPDEKGIEVTPEASSLLNAVLAKNLPVVIDTVQGAKDNGDLLRSFVFALSESQLGARIKVTIWRGIREVSRHTKPTDAELVAALCRVAVGE